MRTETPHVRRAEERACRGEGWRIKEAFVGHRIGGALIGASMAEVEPGSKLWPYHTHHASEEWVIVLRGDTPRARR